MPENEQPDDYLHLPTAGDRADAAKRAKAELWQKVAEKRRSKIAAASAFAEPTPAEITAPEQPLHDDNDWADLLSLDPDAEHVPLPPMHLAAPAVIISTPVEVETRGDMSSQKRSVIRRPVPKAADPEVITDVLVKQVAPRASHETEVFTQVLIAKSPAAQSTPELQDTLPLGDESVEPVGEKAASPTNSDKPSDAEKAPESARSLLQLKWEKWGGRSLAISLCIHAFIIGGGGFLVVSQGMLDQQVDFLPGGTKQGAAASQDLQHKVQQKKKTWLNKPVPLRKIAVNTFSEMVLPDEPPDILSLPQSSNLLSSAKIGGLSGGGGGFGKGMGLGAKGGMVFQPLSMFGREIKAKRLALVLDVSTSMAPYLPRVIEELDKVARDSVVVLFFGCGLDTPTTKGIDGKELFRTSGIEFEKFWRMGGPSLEDARKFKFKPGDVIPSESIYRLLAKRPQTYFIHNVGLSYAWLALLSEQVRPADALYWFSDFQDHVDFKQIMVVKENLLRRKQKLYIQPYMHGSSFDLINSQLVTPTGGEVIEAQLE